MKYTFLLAVLLSHALAARMSLKALSGLAEKVEDAACVNVDGVQYHVNSTGTGGIAIIDGTKYVQTSPDGMHVSVKDGLTTVTGGEKVDKKATRDLDETPERRTQRQSLLTRKNLR